MYWTDQDTDKIQRANLDGSDIEDLFPSGIGYPRNIGIALDVGEGKMYWTDRWSKFLIRRADLDGSNVENLLTSLYKPLFIALDAVRGKMYWAVYDQVDVGRDASAIYRAALDGSNVEGVVGAKAGSREFILDVDGGKIYWDYEDVPPTWYPEAPNFIRRADLDGSNVEDLVLVLMESGIPRLLDVGEGKVYWSKMDWMGEATIQRTELDDSNTEVLITGISTQQLVLDAAGGKIYWTDWGTDYWSPDGTIQRANLDGSNVEILVTGLFEPSIALAIPHPVPTLVSTHSTVPPTTSRLEPNYPNPFNSTTQISYRLAIPGPVRLDVYNILGQQVHTLVDQVQAAGFYQVPWNARDQRGAAAATGVYLMRLHHPGGVQTRRLLLLK